jgi:hypothetical protein
MTARRTVMSTLRHHQDEFFEFTGTHARRDDGAVRARMWAFQDRVSASKSRATRRIESTSNPLLRPSTMVSTPRRR